DDHSTDETPVILDALAAEYPRLRVLHNPAPQPGWQGKSNAVWRALETAERNKPWLLFTDADVVFHPQALRRLVAFAEHEKLGYLTCLPLLEAGTWAEGLMVPLPWRGVLSGGPQERLHEPDASPVGIGAFMLMRRDLYGRSGGHSVYSG